jgi:photosystem II stability/assembly factor-like uncharacterized protein
MTHRFSLLLLAVVAFAAGRAFDAHIMHGLRSDKAERRAHDKPGEADRFFYAQRTWPDGIPEHWYEQARAHVARMQESPRKTASGWTWQSVGPTNIAGRIRAMAMDPSDANVLYAGAAGGGVWKTTDGAKTWRPLTDFAPNLRIGSLAVHPTDSRVVLAGNGEGFVLWQDGLAYGRGILRSTDAGETWNVIASTENANFEFVFGIAYDPFDPQIVLASTRTGVQRSTDGGETWTFQRFSGKRGMMCEFSRTTEGLVYAAIETRGVYRSTDHGATWSGILASGIQTSGFARVQIATAPSNGDIVYAAYTALDETCAGVFKTTNRGDSWVKITTPTSEIDGADYMREQGSYNSVLAVNPTNPNLVWAGGIDIYRSTDGGTTWKQVTNWFSVSGYQYVHADQHALLINPKNSFQMYAGCDGGVYKTTNAGATFTDANAGLITTQFHSGTPHPTTDVVLGGTIDNGNLKISAGTTWSDVTGGDGGWTAIDYKNPRTMYAEIYYLDFYKSTNYGAAGSWRSKMSGIPTSGSGGTSDRVGFMAPFEMDRTDPTRLYAGTYRLYRTTNSAELWSPISTDLTGGSGYLTAIGLTAATQSVIYTGASTGAVFVSTNAGTVWKRSNTGLPARYVTDIAVDHADPARAWVTLSGFGTAHVYRTTDYGTTWSDASGTAPMSLPDVPASTIVVNPRRPAHIIVGTDVGVFESADEGATWQIRNESMGNVTIADLQFRADGVLYAATHGRGMFRSNMSLTGTTPPGTPAVFHVGQPYPNPVSGGAVSVPFNLDARTRVRIEVRDLSGRLVHAVDLRDRDAGAQAYTFDAAGLRPGVYLMSIDAGAARRRTLKFAVL